MSNLSHSERPKALGDQIDHRLLALPHAFDQPIGVGQF